MLQFLGQSQRINETLKIFEAKHTFRDTLGGGKKKYILKLMLPIAIFIFN